MSKTNAGHIVLRSDEPDKIITGSRAIAATLVHKVAKKLQEVYPSYVWHVRMAGDHSVVEILCHNTDFSYGYVLKTLDFECDPDLKAVVQAGGEILERSNLSRNRVVKYEDTFANTIDISGAKSVKNGQKNIIQVVR